MERPSDYDDRNDWRLTATVQEELDHLKVSERGGLLWVS